MQSGLTSSNGTFAATAFGPSLTSIKEIELGYCRGALFQRYVCFWHLADILVAVCLFRRMT